MSRIRIRKLLLPRTSLSGPSGVADFPSGGRKIRLKLIHPSRIRRSISADRLGISVAGLRDRRRRLSGGTFVPGR